MAINILLALAALVIGSVAEIGAALQNSERAWGEPALGLRSSISVQKARIAKGSDFNVTFIIENTSKEAVRMETIAAFTLSPMRDVRGSDQSPSGYWCPIDIEGGRAKRNRDLVMATRSTLALEKSASFNSTTDLSRHGWDRANSSIWPAKRFGDLIPEGKYVLQLDVEVVGTQPPKRIHSNEIQITIE